MLASMTPDQFDEWLAEHNIEPWGDDWQQAGTIAKVVENKLGAIIAAFAGCEPPPLKQAQDYYRPDTSGGDAGGGPQWLTPEESQRLARLKCGV